MKPINFVLGLAVLLMTAAPITAQCGPDGCPPQQQWQQPQQPRVGGLFGRNQVQPAGPQGGEYATPDPSVCRVWNLGTVRQGHAGSKKASASAAGARTGLSAKCSQRMPSGECAYPTDQPSSQFTFEGYHIR